MTQEWYQTIDDYGLYLLKANVDLAGPGIAAKIARAGGLASGPVAGVYLAANVLALGALVAFDPSGMRQRGPTASRVIEAATLMEKAYSEWTESSSNKSTGMIKDQRGVIEVV